MIDSTAADWPDRPEPADTEASLRFATEAGGLGVWELDLRTGALKCSPLFKQAFGRDLAAPFTIDQLTRLIHPDDRDRADEAIARAIATGEDYESEYRVVRPDGDARWLHMRAKLVRSADGTPLMMAGISQDMTDRRAAERRLALSEESLRLATEAAEVGTWDLDLTSDVLTWSDRTRAMFGIAPQTPVSMADFEATLHPEDRAAVMRAFGSALEPGTQGSYDVEYRTVGRADGAIRWVAAKGRGVFEHGRCVRAIGTAIDITARKAAEDQLRASEVMLAESRERFRAITDSIDQMIWSCGPDGNHDFFNQRWYDYTGLSPGWTDGDGWRGMLHPDDQEHVWARWQQSLTSGKPYEIEYRLRHRSSVYRWVLSRAVPQRDEQQRIVRWFGTWTDIHDIVAAREILARSRQQLEREVAARTRERDRTWNNAQDLLVVLDKAGVLRAANPACLSVLGWPPDEIVGQPYLDLIHPDDQASSRFALSDTRQERLPSHRNRIRHRDGSFRWIEWVASREGELIFGSGRDITVAKAAAEKLAQTEDQLRQAQKMEAVGQLTGGMAHDFNNMLTGIVGALELLQRRVAEGRYNDLERYTSVANASASRAAALVQRLLAFARRQPLSPQPTDANALLSGMQDMLQRTLGPAVELRLMLSPTLPRALCDTNQLESAVLNLAINARDAMPGGGKLSISTAATDSDATHGDELAPGPYVTITVTDTGTGMAPEIMARVFEPFFTTKPIGQGTGLGLSMVYGFVKQSNGHVRVQSEPDRGTTFQLYLPQFEASIKES